MIRPFLVKKHKKYIFIYPNISEYLSNVYFVCAFLCVIFGLRASNGVSTVTTFRAVEAVVRYFMSFPSIVVVQKT